MRLEVGLEHVVLVPDLRVDVGLRHRWACPSGPPRRRRRAPRGLPRPRVRRRAGAAGTARSRCPRRPLPHRGSPDPQVCRCPRRCPSAANGVRARLVEVNRTAGRHVAVEKDVNIVGVGAQVGGLVGAEHPGFEDHSHGGDAVTATTRAEAGRDKGSGSRARSGRRPLDAGCRRTWSMTRWRSALERATTRAHMSPTPVMVLASSTSAMSARCSATASWPAPWRISSVRNAVTGKPSASGERSGPPAGDHAGRGELVEPGLHGAAGDAEASRGLEDADPRLGREQVDHPAVQRVHEPSGDCASCPTFRRTVAHLVVRRQGWRHDDDP